MDADKLARLDQLLGQLPPTWSNDELLAIMGDAAEREADGEPVGESYPQLAAYFRLHPEAADEYRSLVWLVQQERAGALDLAAAPAQLPVPARPAVDQERARQHTGRFRLHFSAGAVRGQPDRPPATMWSEQELAIPELNLVFKARVRAEAEVGSLFIALKQQSESAAALAGAAVKLYDVPTDENLAVLSAAPLEVKALDRQDSVRFGELDLGGDYYALVELASGEQVVLHIDADFWP
jgi:hypothetical protein